MTHPLTPREKVAQAVRAASRGQWTDGVRVGSAKWCNVLTDDILTALASGSGDHAELARLAESLMEDARKVADMPRNDKRDEQAGYSALASVSLTSILAESAALRERLETARFARVEHNRQYEELRSRATEAERKLAEAVRIFKQIEEHHGIECIPDNEIQAEIRTFLSKEAEQ